MSVAIGSQRQRAGDRPHLQSPQVYQQVKRATSHLPHSETRHVLVGTTVQNVMFDVRTGIFEAFDWNKICTGFFFPKRQNIVSVDEVNVFAGVI